MDEYAKRRNGGMDKVELLDDSFISSNKRPKLHHFNKQNVFSSPSRSSSSLHLNQKANNGFETAFNVFIAKSFSIKSTMQSSKKETTKSLNNNNNNKMMKKKKEAVSGVSPPMAEIEAFFSIAENYEQKRFVEKYNYDIVKDVPLQGRYQWLKLKP